MTSVGELLQHWAPHFVSYAGAMLVQSSLVILLLLAADMLLRHRVRPAIRYAIWMLALAKLLLPPTLTSPTSPAYWLSERLRAVTVTAAPVIRDAADPVPGETADPVPGDAATDPDRAVLMPAPVGRTEPLALSGPGIVSVPVALFAVWMGGVLLLVVRVVRAGHATRRLIAIADAPSPNLVALIDECRRQLGVKRPIDARCTSLAHVPALLGFWNPVILVPAPLLASLTPAQLRAVLLHEVAHCKRGDVWVDGVQALVQVVHWYNPLVWVANSVIRQVREQAVDEVVLMHMGETPEVYPETLLHVARMALPSPVSVRVAGVAILERGTGLRRRITRMLEGPTPSTVRVGVWNVLLIGAAALIVLPMAPRAASVARGNLCESASAPPSVPFDFALYEKRKEEWLACIESRPDDVNVIEQAGDFVEFFDPGLAGELFERARAPHPDNPRWISKMALHRLNARLRDGSGTNFALEAVERAQALGRPCESLSWGRGAFAGMLQAPFYAKLKAQWLACIESRPTNVSIIEEVADFATRYDPALVRDLFERASALEPANSRWRSKLADLDRQDAHFRLRSKLSELPWNARRLRRDSAAEANPALEDAERAVAMGTAQFLDVWLPQMAVDAEFMIEARAYAEATLDLWLPAMAFDAGDLIKAGAYAEQLVAKSRQGKWRDATDAISVDTMVHQGNQVLGRIAVREGRLRDAITFLHRSGEVSGSNFVWPSMSLAKELLEAGETAAVLAYFEQCRKFWNESGEKLDLWSAEVRTGRVPYFGPDV